MCLELKKKKNVSHSACLYNINKIGENNQHMHTLQTTTIPTCRTRRMDGTISTAVGGEREVVT